MKYIDEFRRREQAQGLLGKIREVSAGRYNIMEICGTHTHTISRYGIREAMPKNLKLISGPGCPVCVTSAGDIQRIIDFAGTRDDVIITTFGDMLRVPGTRGSLQEAKAGGADVRVVYSPLNTLDIAVKNPDKEVLFYAVGFETTVPTVAATVLTARDRGIKNFSVLSLHKLTPPAMRALIQGGEIEIHGFLAPGHVTTIIGAGAYGFLSEEFDAPCVVAGFEPLDAIHGLYMLALQLEERRSDIEIQYRRVVTWEGNTRAQEIMDRVFTPADAYWRGVGPIPGSGLAVREEFAEFDAEKRFTMPSDAQEAAEPPGCECGSVLKGLITPSECPLFASACTPEKPVGPCMVSSEGTCAAYYKYRSVELEGA